TSKVVTLPNVRTEMSFWQRYAPLAAAAMLVISLGLIYLLRSTNAKNQALQKELAEVKLSEGILKNELANISNKYASLVNFNNDIIVVSATEKYPATSIYFHHNPVDKKNYIQLQNLPEIDNTKQSFQLWSIKGDNAPTPLDVFQKDGTAIVEVKHVEETNVYAITIENKGGATTPNLADLIGTFAIKG
ncbi:MAG: anti-sigma factor, partial [Chitinophagales bacterium]